MAKDVTLWLWDSDNEVWVKLAGTASGAMSIKAIVEALTDIEDVDAAAPTDLHILYWNDGNSKWEARAFADWEASVATITFIIDGGGSAITTGQKGHIEVPFACTINRNTMLADQSGSIVVDIWKAAYGSFPPADGNSITAAAVPTISGATKSQDSTLSGWTTAIAAGDILAFNVDSVTDIKRLTLSLKATKT